MAKLVFDAVGERIFETGVSNGVLFRQTGNAYETGVAWNGLTSVAQSPDGGDANDQYADNIKYLSLRGKENQNGTIEAFTYPEEFNPCMGYYGGSGMYVLGQTKKPFSFVYKTVVGNDEEGIEYGEKLHIVYNATVNPVEKTYETINDSPEAMTFSWEYTTTPLTVTISAANATKLAGSAFSDLTKVKEMAVFEIEKTDESEAVYTALENSIYGTDPVGQEEGTDPTLLTPTQIIAMIADTIQ